MTNRQAEATLERGRDGDAAAARVGSDVLTVTIVDDHQAFADLLAGALDREPGFRCVGIADSTVSAVDLVRRERPDVVVMDIRLGRDNGLEATRRIRDVLPGAVIVVVSAHQDVDLVVRAAQAGASAFAAKTGSLQELMSVLREAKLGSMLVGPSTFRAAPRVLSPPGSGVESLSTREHEVLILMSKALAPQEIAPLLNITVNTCRGYVKSIHAKLRVRSQLEAVVKAQKLGLIDIRSES